MDEASTEAVQYGKWGKQMENLASQSGVKITMFLEDEKEFTPDRRALSSTSVIFGRSGKSEKINDN